MNPEVTKLLVEAGVPHAVSWQDVIVSLAPSSGEAYSDDEDWDRGFNLVVLDHGAPEYYCKFRPHGDSGLDRETRVRQHLRSGETGELSIPDVRTASSGNIDVQVSPFIRGSHYGRIAPRQSVEEYLQTVGSMLRGAGHLSDVAQETSLVESERVSRINLREACEEHLAYLDPLLGLDRESFDALANALSEAGDVPCRPQHGDLWWRNLLVDSERVWVIDLEDFGTVQVPLYDAFALLSSTVSLRSDGSTGEIEYLFGDSADSNGCRDLLTARAEAEGISGRQLEGVLAYYVTHRASVVHRRSGSPYADPHLANVRFVADSLAAGRPLFSVDQ